VSTEPLRDALAEALPDRPFTVRFWDGAELASTNGAGSPTFTVRSPLALGHVLRSPGQLGIGRAYVAGALDVDDIDATLALLDGYDPPPVDVRTKARLAAAAVRAGGLTAGHPARDGGPSCAPRAGGTASSATGAPCATTTTSRTRTSPCSSTPR
jgi:hypothetical protein